MRVADRAQRTALDASGAVADLGVLLPIVAALVLKNGFDAGTILVLVGGLYIAAGLYFEVPVPVQPVKAAAAIAIARDLPSSALATAGLVLGFVLLLLGVTRLAVVLAKIFTPPVIRGLQLGVGLILIKAAVLLQRPVSMRTLVIAGTLAIALAFVGARNARVPLALVVFVGGIVVTAVGNHPTLPASVSVWRPETLSFSPGVLWSALVLLVIPQVPLTFGNAVVAFADLERQYFGDRAYRVTPRSVSLSCGLANVAAGALGGMPMCHGSNGLTAHYRAGARTNHMNLMIGGALLAIGLFYGKGAVVLFAFVPIAVLIGLLAFSGAMHASLVRDQRGAGLAIAVGMGLIGVVTANLAWSLAFGLTTTGLLRVRQR